MCFSSARLLSSVISILVYCCPGGTLLLRVVAKGRTFLPLLQDMTKTKQAECFHLDTFYPYSIAFRYRTDLQNIFSISQPVRLKTLSST